MSGIISAEPFNRYFPETMGEDQQTATYRGFVTAIYEVGCLIGAAFILWQGDRIGRRRSMMLGGTIMVIGVIIQVSAVKGHKAMAQFIIGRTITGVGNGIVSRILVFKVICSADSL